MSQFFDDPKFQDDLRQAAEAARAHGDSLAPPASISEGDSFLFSESLDRPVRWVATQQHKDNGSLWYLLAADEFPMVGANDVEQFDPTSADPLVVRCDVGFWAHEDDIPLKRFVGRMTGDVVADCRDRLAEMIRGQVIPTAREILTGSDEEYRDWIAELSGVAEQIESRIQAEPVVIKIATQDTKWISDTRICEFREQASYSLAADAVGEHGESKPPSGTILECSLPGVLVLQSDEPTFDVVYYPVNEVDIPPALGDASGVLLPSGHWAKGSDNAFTWSIGLRPIEGRLQFSIGANRFDIEFSPNE